MMMGECRPLSARITERQCRINQERGLFSCGRCDGLVGIVDIDVEEEIVSKRGTCAKCKRPDMCIVARDLCGKCYAEEKEKGFPPLDPAEAEELNTQIPVEQPVAPPVVVKAAPRSLLSMITPPPTVKPEGLFLDFSDRPGLLVDLEAISDNVPGDILELCSMLVSGKLRMVA